MYALRATARARFATIALLLLASLASDRAQATKLRFGLVPKKPTMVASGVVPKNAREQRIYQDMHFLTQHRSERDPADPTFKEVLDWAAKRFETMGLLPRGTGKSGLSRYQQPFSYPQGRKGKQPVTSLNVLAELPGTPGASQEAILVMAHVDGISKGQKTTQRRMLIKPMKARYEGANDNASGVSAVLEIAHELTELQKSGGLKRRVIFAIVSGEEAGYLGSSALAHDATQLGDARIVAVVNYDSVARPAFGRKGYLMFGGDGRQDTVANPVFARAIATAPAADTADIKNGLDYRRPWPTFHGRLGPIASVIVGLASAGRKNVSWQASDHVVFKNHVPSIYYFGGMDSDMHSSKDTLARADMTGIAGVARHGARAVAELANTKDKISDGITLPLR